MAKAATRTNGKAKTNGRAKAAAPKLEPSRLPPQAKKIEIPGIEIGRVEIPVDGTSPLISHAWGKKAITQMLDKQKGKATTKKPPKDPVEDYFESMHIIEGDPRDVQKDPEIPMSSKQFAKAGVVHGVPATAFRKAMIRGAKMAGSVMTDARCAFLIHAQQNNLLPLEFDGVAIRQDMVRISQGTADIRFRAEYTNWRVVLPIQFSMRQIGVDQLVNLLSLAGFSVGVLEWRPERDGSFGTFAVDASSISKLDVESLKVS